MVRSILLLLDLDNFFFFTFFNVFFLNEVANVKVFLWHEFHDNRSLTVSMHKQFFMKCRNTLMRIEIF